jgi:hypothetical protein
MFAVLDSHLPANLIGSSARERLDQIGGLLPAALTRRVYFECRLGEALTQVDVVLGVDEVSRALLSDAASWLPARLQGHPLWAGIARLCGEWQKKGTALAAGIYDLWLEFDADDRCGTTLVPSVFIGLTESRRRALPDLWSVARASIELVRGAPASTETMRTVPECLGSLPASATLSYVGTMYPRDRRALRLCVTSLRGAVLLDYLRSIGWPGAIDTVAATLGAIRAGSGATALEETTILHFDVDAVVQPRIGLEVYFPQWPQIIEGAVDATLLNSLCELQLCTPSKRDALVTWPGHTTEHLPHECWPSLVLRRLSHVKLVFDAGCPAHAKAYLSVFHGFSPRRSQAPLAGVSA